MHIPIILIIEDDPGFNSILQKSLVQKGYKILSSVSVIEAKAKLRNQKFDCILLDLHLEGGSGESIISTIRGNKKDANFASPVIVMSGFLEPDVVKRNYAHGTGHAGQATIHQHYSRKSKVSRWRP